jgi:putative ABC transport system substrate-binding protein
VHLKVDIIVAAGGDLTVGTVKNVTKTVPIVMVGGGIDPVEAGLVESLARPGGNVTGLTNLLVQLGAKRLELLKEAVPKLTRVAVLYDLAVPNNVLELKELQTAARPLGLTVQPEARDADGFERVFAALSKERPDGLYVLEAPAVILTKNDRGLCFEKPVAIDVQQQRSCRCWRAHILRRGLRGQLSARRLFYRQNS